MTESDLQQLRRQKWRLDGKPVRTIEDARGFIESVGICLMYPQQTAVLAPTFIGASAGNEERLPTWQHAYSDPRVEQAKELMVRLLRERAAYEANVFENNNFLIAASVFPYLYALIGERNPRRPPMAGSRSEYSQLAADAFAVIHDHGPISKRKLQETLGGDISMVALDRGLNELWSRLRITRVDYDAKEGASWDVLFRWAPDPVREGINLSVAEGISALISKYLDCVIAAEQPEIESFLGHLVPRSRVRDAVNALLAARELSFVKVNNRSLIQITPEKPPPFSPPPVPVRRPRTVPRATRPQRGPGLPKGTG